MTDESSNQNSSIRITCTPSTNQVSKSPLAPTKAYNEDIQNKLLRGIFKFSAGGTWNM